MAEITFYRQALAPIELSRSPHLIPDQLECSHRLADDEAREVVLRDPARWHAAGRHADTDIAGFGLDFDHERSERVQTVRRSVDLDTRGRDMGVAICPSIQ